MSDVQDVLGAASQGLANNHQNKQLPNDTSANTIKTPLEILNDSPSTEQQLKSVKTPLGHLQGNTPELENSRLPTQAMTTHTSQADTDLNSPSNTTDSISIEISVDAINPDQTLQIEETTKTDVDNSTPISTPSSPVVINETYGTNTAQWIVDDKGRPISVEAKLDSTYSTPRSSTEKDLQASVGGSARLTDDDGGHMVGHRFMSDQGEKNLFPQNSNFNRSAYKKMENEWADWTSEGYEVKLKVELHPPGSERPTDVTSKYDVYDPQTGERVFRRDHRFNNVAGEAFERVSKSDIESFRD